MELPIVFEDQDLLIINKPAGVAVQSTSKTDSIEVIYKEYGIVHRLDQRVSGLMILAKNTEAFVNLTKQFVTGGIVKKYKAVVKKAPEPAENELVQWHRKSRTQNRAIVSDEKVGNAKKCILSYKICGQSTNYTLVDVVLRTGRFHQIRAQFAKIGSPIVGDLKYGYARSTADGSIYLHAYLLEFTHPTSNENIKIDIETPQIWQTLGL